MFCFFELIFYNAYLIGREIQNDAKWESLLKGVGVPDFKIDPDRAQDQATSLPEGTVKGPR